jgi:hypothetical protein
MLLASKTLCITLKLSVQSILLPAHSWMGSTPRVRTLLTMEESKRHTTHTWGGLNAITWSLACLVSTTHHARCSGCLQHRLGVLNIGSRPCANASPLVCILLDSSVSLDPCQICGSFRKTSTVHLVHLWTLFTSVKCGELSSVNFQNYKKMVTVKHKCCALHHKGRSPPHIPLTDMFLND